MKKIDFFKLQAKNLCRDFKTQKCGSDGVYLYFPKYFPDIDDLIVSFDIDEDHFSLMKAQHLIAYLAGFKTWSELLHASDEALELGELLLNNRNRFNSPLRENWDMYLEQNGMQNSADESKLEVFKIVFLNIPC